LISRSVTPGAFCAAAAIAIAPLSSKQPNKIRNIARPPLLRSDHPTPGEHIIVPIRRNRTRAAPSRR
jgi:hypothetical protein